MASLGMGRCHTLTDEKIDEGVIRTSPGNYALGYLDDGTFIPYYVGRSDSDVGGRLHSWVGVDSRPTCLPSAASAAFGSRRRRSLPSLPWEAPALRPVGIAVDGRYTHFVFGYAASAEAAFQNECRNYHDFGGSYGLDNERHPVPPEGVRYRCLEDTCA